LKFVRARHKRLRTSESGHQQTITELPLVTGEVGVYMEGAVMLALSIIAAPRKTCPSAAFFEAK
jgi:hypothetical protein